MKKWQCTVCGYIFTGEEPPETCPACQAPKSQFVELIETPAEPADEPAARPAPSASTETRSSGPEASASAKSPGPATWFEKVAVAIDNAVAPVFRHPRYQRIFDQMTRFHGHPMMVHIPNGLVPIAVLFMFMAAVFDIQSMGTAAVCNMGVIALSMPVVLITGWVDWQNRFRGAVTDVFKIKFICGGVVTLLSWILFIWLLINPKIFSGGGVSLFFFFVLSLCMLAGAIVAGWYGGKLVFRK